MSKRIQAIDVLRGMTLFGIILVNAATINGPFYLNEIGFAFVFSMSDYILGEIMAIALLCKSYPIFVLLFGIGTKLLLDGLIKKYPSNTVVFNIHLKRMLVLGMFGFIHGALFYWGDVLLMYSILGIIAGALLIFVFKKDYKSLLRFNLSLIFISFVINGIMYVNIYYDQHHSSLSAHIVDTLSNKANDAIDSVPLEKKDYEDEIVPNAGKFSSIYQEGRVNAIIQKNLASFNNTFFAGFYHPMDTIISLQNMNYLLEVFIIIILGMIAASIPVWECSVMDYDNKRLLKLILCFGIPFVFSEYLIAATDYGDFVELFSVFLIINNIVLYLLIFLFLYNFMKKRTSYQSILNSFAAIGSMTLTWYLLQSLIMGFLLFNYGFGLYGKVGISECVIFAVLYYLICYIVSPLWIAKFKQGPIEKLWRGLTMPKSYCTAKKVAEVE